MRNLITDVPGVKVGHASDAQLGSGSTAIIFEEPAVASIDVRGGGPGTRETALLDPAQTVEGIDAITLSGGSAFGLDAASGVQAWLKEQNRGFAVRTARVPIVPAAILFDLLSGGDKNWGRFPPYRELGYAAAAAADADFVLGSVGAGTGATTVNCKGGVGSASAQSADGCSVGALAVVNAVGSVIVGSGPWFWPRHSSATANSAAADYLRSFQPMRSNRAPKAACRRTRHWWSSPPTPSSARRKPNAWPSWPNPACRGRSIRCIHRWTAMWCLPRRPAAARSPMRNTARIWR